MDSLGDDSRNAPTTAEETAEKGRLIKLACFNSRSLNNKSTALIDIFDETEVSACLISETWMRDNKETRARVQDMVELSLIHI